MHKSIPKRYNQRQLTEMFCTMGDVPKNEWRDYRMNMWVNPTDDNSLRLSLSGLQYVKSNLDLKSYEFRLSNELTNHNLLQLERLFKGMYYLMRRQKIIVFDEEEAMMLHLHGNDLKTYLDNLESVG